MQSSLTRISLCDLSQRLKPSIGSRRPSVKKTEGVRFTSSTFEEVIFRRFAMTFRSFCAEGVPVSWQRLAGRRSWALRTLREFPGGYVLTVHFGQIARRGIEALARDSHGLLEGVSAKCSVATRER